MNEYVVSTVSIVLCGRVNEQQTGSWVEPQSRFVALRLDFEENISEVHFSHFRKGKNEEDLEVVI